MLRTGRGAFAGFFALLWLCMLIAPARASFSVTYCSSQNTAGDFGAQYWEWQSNGWCTDKCNQSGKYAYAVILTHNCWCSNYAPGDQQDTSDCNDNCPGFPDEKCGNEADNLYIYVKLANSPSGTQGGSKPTSSNPSSAPPSPTPSTPETSRDPETVVQTVTPSREVVTLTPTPSDTSTQTTLKTTSSSEETTTVAPQTSVRIVTESGNIVTQTVVTTPTSALSKKPNQKSSSSTGAIVGGVVGGIAGVAAVVGGIFFLLRRRRQQHMQEDGTQSGVQRNTSTMSKAGLLQTEKDPRYPPPIATAFTRRQSRTLDQDSISPISGSDRRNSRLQVDQRLNPSAIFMFDNSSAASVASMDDSRDYHRTLNIRNPDPQ